MQQLDDINTAVKQTDFLMINHVKLSLLVAYISGNFLDMAQMRPNELATWLNKINELDLVELREMLSIFLVETENMSCRIIPHMSPVRRLIFDTTPVGGFNERSTKKV